jgi:hypothetical protein
MSFRQEFDSRNLKLTTNPNADYLVLFNHVPDVYKRYLKSGGSFKKSVLVRFEAETIFPKQYSKKLVAKYGLVISPGRSERNPDCTVIGWPYEVNFNPLYPNDQRNSIRDVLMSEGFSERFKIKNWSERRIAVSMILSNKVSPVKSSQYGLRRTLARTASRTDLEIYGELWNDPFSKKMHHRIAVFVSSLKQGSIPNLKSIAEGLFSQYSAARGPIKNKHEVLRQSKYTLIIENSKEVMTEKFFDAIINGCIPIYFGPNLKSMEIPDNLAIVTEGDWKDIEMQINETNPQLIQRQLDSMLDFLTHENFLENWDYDHVMKKISQRIIGYFNMSQK